MHVHPATGTRDLSGIGTIHPAGVRSASGSCLETILLSGEQISVATNPRLLANRFCSASTPVEIQPLASGIINQDTLLCSFPDPALTIALAAILSWPSYIAGWILESAPTVSGPWTDMRVTPSFEDDATRVTVGTDAAHRFFRLRKP